MSTKHLIAAAALSALSSAVYADSPEYMRPDLDAYPASTKTRAQVTDELRQAQSQGLTNVREDEYPLIQQTSRQKTRAQVLAELREAQAQGSTNSRDDVYPIIPRTGSARTRAEVRAEAVQSAHNARNNRGAQGLYFGG